LISRFSGGITMHRFRNVIVTAVMFAASSSAFAHSHPKTMLPAKDSTVSAPAEVSIEFSEGLEPKFSSLSLLNAHGAVVSKVPAVLDPVDNKHLTLALPLLSAGVYTVRWVSSSIDGHRLSGDYSFTVK
jgi:methionine-rich copper-binding protein CopC